MQQDLTYNISQYFPKTVMHRHCRHTWVCRVQEAKEQTASALRLSSPGQGVLGKQDEIAVLWLTVKYYF